MDRFEQIEKLFHEAIELPQGDRAAFLDRACQAGTPLREEVDLLLSAALVAQGNPAWQSGAIANEANLIGAEHDATEFDRYRLLERIGAGGMGVVYKAVRSEDDISQTVAIKIVHAMPRDEMAQARFAQERRILARLEHPNIARLIDAGATPGGLPFLVMEYVDGVALTDYLAAAGLSARAVLQLFRKICSAVSCTHRNLIIHRDLKPANILMTPAGEPKLLDFGVATLTDGSALRTKTGAGALTPEYASPEQVRGEPVGASSDIYTLGVLLYQMLTGKYPYRQTTSALDLAQAITAEPPLALNSGGKRFDSDLETIVSMALRKEPDRRYGSVEQFSLDVQKYLDGYPVSARPDTPGYRVRKFVRRHRFGIAAAALVLVAITGGVAATLREASIANRRFTEVRTLANTYLFEIHDAIKDLPGATPVRRLVVKRALESLARLSKERGNDRALGLELAAAYSKTAQIQGGAVEASLGDRPGAVASYKTAVAILEPLASALPRDMDAGRELAKDYADLSSLLTFMGDLKGSAEYARKSIALSEKLVAVRPADMELRETLATGYESLADVSGNPNYPNLGDTKSALSNYQKALKIDSKLAAEQPANLLRQREVATLDGRLGQIYQALDDKPAAIGAYTAAVDADERILRMSPLSAPARWDAAAANHNLALSLLRMSRVEEAHKRSERSTEIFEEYSKTDPKNTEARIAVADCYYTQGYVNSSAKDDRAAIAFYKRAVGVYNEVIAANPGVGSPPGLRTTYQLLADSQLASGDAAGSIASAAKELELDDRLLIANPANAGAKRNQALASRQTGRAYEKLGKLREARDWYQRALDIYLAQQSAGKLIPMYSSDIDKIRGYIANCGKALAGSR